MPDRSHLAAFGHGHVRPRADGLKARCGGPPICSECAREFARVQEEGLPTVAQVREIVRRARVKEQIAAMNRVIGNADSADQG